MAERKWTNDEATQLIELAEAGLTVDEIGERLDRTGGAVRVKANRIGVDFYVRDIGKFPAKRRSEKLDCMMCRLPMVSTWAGNRICDSCKKTELYRCS
ncbi:hypothetical protein [Allorhizobium undicola]|uniref:hypothetical protein n=1 Tax=Allorhizobium undicola TaxID=78527 RepID=UPI00048052A3|nr:hypothetical protein [Allorhizobium undicola]